MKIIQRVIISLILCLFLSGCNAFYLRDANKMLVDLYTTKLELDRTPNKPDEKLILSGNIHESFSKLAKDSAAEAEKIGTNKLNKIAFYRIASTASWQAMNTATNDENKDAAKNQIMAYSKAGFLECSNPKEAPRDCAMLLIIPTLAGIDEHTKIFEDFNKKMASGEATEEDALELFKTEKTAITLLVDGYNKISETDIHPDFLNHLKEIMRQDYCQRVNQAKNIILRKFDENSQKFKDTAKEAEDIKKSLIKIGIDGAALNCI